MTKKLKSIEETLKAFTKDSDIPFTGRVRWVHPHKGKPYILDEDAEGLRCILIECTDGYFFAEIDELFLK